VATPPTWQGDLSLEHFAFAAEGLAEFLRTLAAAKVQFQVSVPPGGASRQVHIVDPEGNHLHIDFRADEPTT
jgi:hypothetical protein